MKGRKAGDQDSLLAHSKPLGTQQRKGLLLLRLGLHLRPGGAAGVEGEADTEKTPRIRLLFFSPK